MKSPYLNEYARLGDVVAAIQAMATYKFYKLDFEGWADRINADKARAAHWKLVFEEHPEFFRLDSERKRASLVWRRQYPKRFNVDTLKEITVEDFNKLDDTQKRRIPRVPLPASDIKTLLDTAIELHSRAIEAEKHRYWLIPIVLPALAALFGAVIGAWASDHFRPQTPPQASPQIQVPAQPK